MAQRHSLQPVPKKNRVRIAPWRVVKAETGAGQRGSHSRTSACRGIPPSISRQKRTYGRWKNRICWHQHPLRPALGAFQFPLPMPTTKQRNAPLHIEGGPILRGPGQTLLWMLRPVLRSVPCPMHSLGRGARPWVPPPAHTPPLHPPFNDSRCTSSTRDALERGGAQCAQPMPIRCLPDGKCQLQWYW